MIKEENAVKNFKTWNKNKQPLYDMKLNQITFKKDEIFVPVWDYAVNKFNHYYYVSNLGHIISFKNMTPIVIGRGGRYGFQVNINNHNYPSSRLIYLSFVAYKLKHGSKNVPSCLSNFEKLKKNKDFFIKHKSYNSFDDSLTNLMIVEK